MMQEKLNCAKMSSGSWNLEVAGCEISTGPGTNASEKIDVFDVFSVKLRDCSGKLPSGPVTKNPKFAA